MEERFLAFLNTTLPTASKAAEEMETLIFTDVNSSITKARIFIEEIVNEIWKIENLLNSDVHAKTLAEKLSFLSKNEYLNNEISNSFYYIRKIGNAAAHNPETLELSQAFTVHREMYAIAIWYLEIYTTENLAYPLYKQPKPKILTEELMKEQMNKLFQEMIGSQEIAATSIVNNTNSRNNVNNVISNENTSKNHLLDILLKLKISSAEAVENANSFSEFKKYLHVERPIQAKLEEILKSNKSQQSSLILLSGSVGDGKSHLLAYLKENKQDLIGEYTIYNDATESFSPGKTALETLSEILSDFSDEKIETTTKKVIIAINLGVLNNFLNLPETTANFKLLKEFIKESEIFSNNSINTYQSKSFSILSFTDFHLYELTAGQATSSYITDILKKITAPQKDNPFYQAYMKDIDFNQLSIIHENYLFLSNEFVIKQLVQTLINVVIEFKHNFSTRHLLNLIADIIIPNKLIDAQYQNDHKRLESTLPYLLFNSPEKSVLLKHISKLNPINNRNIALDNLLVSLNSLLDWRTEIIKYFNDNTTKDWFKSFFEKDSNDDIDETFTISLVCSLYLTNQEFANKFTNNYFINFIKHLYAFNKNDSVIIKDYYRKFKDVLFAWSGSPLKDYIYITQNNTSVFLAQKLKLIPKKISETQNLETTLVNFRTALIITYIFKEKNKELSLEIDYSLFKLLEKVKEGYRPNKKDEEDAINFVEFVDKLMKVGNKEEEIIFEFANEKTLFRLSSDFYADEGFVVEKVE